MAPSFVLLHGPPVRASCWEGTASCLQEAGCDAQVPDVLAHHSSPPAWRNWTRALLDRITPSGVFVLVGHSSASVLAADLATKLPARCVIIVDGDIPPVQGAAVPVRPALRDFIGGLASADGVLPIWTQWFSAGSKRASLVGLDKLASDRAALARFEHGLPKMHVAWFDDTIELARWDQVPAGFIQTSEIYDHAATEARRRGWPVMNLRGTHLDPTLRPAETAAAILAMARQLGG